MHRAPAAAFSPDGRDQTALNPPCGAAWFCVAVFSRREFAVESALGDAGVEAWLPTRTVATAWTDRTKLTIHPLFTGYLFARFHARDASRVGRTRGIYRILSLDQKPIPISDGEIANLRIAVESSVKALPCPYVSGDAVTVEKGPLAGVSGVVVRTKGSTRVVVRCEILRRAVSVEIDANDVEKTKT